MVMRSAAGVPPLVELSWIQGTLDDADHAMGVVDPSAMAMLRTVESLPARSVADNDTRRRKNRNPKPQRTACVTSQYRRISNADC
jgi:hypothetical protein